MQRYDGCVFLTEVTEAMITVLDGGMGQELIRRSGRAPTPLWSLQVLLDQPELVRTLHRDFILAGARVITLNTYSATPERLADVGLAARFDELQSRALSLARAAIDDAGVPGVLLAGCLPPLVESYHPELTPESPEALALYRRIVAAQHGVDFFLCETLSSARDVALAATAACEAGVPVWVSMTLADDGSRTLRSGDSIDSALAGIASLAPVEAVLLNCSRPETIDDAWPLFRERALAHRPDWRLGAYANGFTAVEALQHRGTVEVLEARVDLSPGDYARHARRWLQQGATLVGGCCEVGPEHIRDIAALVSSFRE